jgi:acyl carrier protein
MDLKDFCGKIQQLLEMDPGTIELRTRLDRLEAWDSVAVLSFMVFADQEYGAEVKPKAIAECETVEDLAKVIEASKAK